MSGEEAARSFWVNAAPGEFSRALSLLGDEGFTFRPERFSPLAFATEDRSGLGSSLAALFGFIYIQNRSSMLPPLLLNPRPDEKILDMCASPGGKSLLLARLLGPSGVVAANEPNPKRLATLRRNQQRLNAENMITLSCPGQKLPFPPGSFDAVLVDAPCSGWGTVERHPNIRELWSEEKSVDLAALQRLLLRKAAEVLSPGGRLIYSTCTTNPLENEEQAAWAEAELPLSPLALAAPDGFVPERPGTSAHLLKIPVGEGSQGFFIAGFTRKNAGESRLPPTDGVANVEEKTGVLKLPGQAEAPLCPGSIRVYGRNAFFIPEKGDELCLQGVPWQGLRLGKEGRGMVVPEGGMHCLLPRRPVPGRSAVTDVRLARALLSGQSAPAPAGLPDPAPWYVGELPVGWLRNRGGRLVWSPR